MKIENGLSSISASERCWHTCLPRDMHYYPVAGGRGDCREAEGLTHAHRAPGFGASPTPPEAATTPPMQVRFLLYVRRILVIICRIALCLLFSLIELRFHLYAY